MKIYYVDIDGTICTITNGQYHKAQPLMDNINKVNRLHDEGNTIIYWTARGSISNIDWLEVTKNQLDEWGVKYDDVRVGKPHYDYFICDKATNSATFFSKINGD
tara:strand:- start:4064 stop:4375 length:312 start_codon:yes stop_codon:yes gene_type:complete